MKVKVTIYNDDDHRDIQVLEIAGDRRISPIVTVQEPGDNGRSHSTTYEMAVGDLLIVSLPGT